MSSRTQFSYSSDNLRTCNTVGQVAANFVKATNREVAGSIPDNVIRIFHRNNPSGCTMALGSTQRLRETSTWKVKAARA